MNQDLALACRDDIKGRFGTKRTSSQLWSGECGFGRAQLAKMSRANPEIETEWVSQDVMKKVVRFGLFKEGICLYMLASFELFFHSSNIYWSLYLSGLTWEIGVCVCVCVDIYTHTGIWLWRLTSPKIFSDVVLVWVWKPETQEEPVFQFHSEGRKNPPFSRLVSFFVLFRSSDDGRKPVHTREGSLLYSVCGFTENNV